MLLLRGSGGKEPGGSTSSLYPRPRLFLSGSRATVWDRESYGLLREGCRLCGALQGVKGVSNGATHGNFPALLLPEQAVVAIRRCGALIHNGLPLIGCENGRSGARGELSDDLPPLMESEEAIQAIYSAGERDDGDGRPDKSLQDRIAVFQDLWEKGFHILAGTAYGSTFTIYEGDPDECHSCGSVLVLTGKETLHPSALLAFIRLQGTVAKAAIIAAVKNDGRVIYSSYGFHFASSRPPLGLRGADLKKKKGGGDEGGVMAGGTAGIEDRGSRCVIL